MDFHLNHPQDEDPILDMHRFVLLINHSFSARIRFVGELEVEHAFVEGLEESGELEVEQAYLDFSMKPIVQRPCGHPAAPVGIINQRHEPPSYYGVERPFVDTFIIPTTWFDAGAGVHGTIGAGWRYEAYVMAPLDATRITAEEGLAETSQKGFLSNVRNIAQTARLEYGAFPGLTLGTSFWRGQTGFNFPREDSQIGLIEFDGRYRAGMFAVRGEFAQVFVDGAAELNDFAQRTTGVNPNIASQMRGFYIEPSVRPLPATEVRLRRLRPLRELRHPVPDAAGRAAAEAVRSRRLDCRRVLLSRSGHCREDRLHGGPEPELAVPERRQPECRIGLVVLMATHLARTGAVTLLLLLSGASGSSQDRTIVKIAAERFTFTPSRVTVKRGAVIEFRLRSDDTNHGFKIVGSSANVIIPKRGRGEATLIFTADTPGPTPSNARRCAAPATASCAGRFLVEE